MNKALRFSNSVLDRILKEENNIDLKSIKADFKAGVDPVLLMNKMEKYFKIPMINDSYYNFQNKDVMKLYKSISESRKFEELDEELEL